MSDEMIQQQRGSAGPLVAGLVAGGTVATLSSVKKPGWAREAAKYASWDDVIKDMPKDNFVATIKDIDADLETKAGDLKNAVTEAEGKYNEALEGAIKNYNPSEGDSLKKVYDEASTALTNKKESLLEEAKKTIKEANPEIDKKELEKKAEAQIKEALEKTTEQTKFNEARKAIEEKLLSTGEGLEVAGKKVKSKETYIKDAMKNKNGNYEKDFAKLFEKGKVKTGKLALLTAGSAVAVWALGKLFTRNKNN